MSIVSATSTEFIAADPDATRAALSDYTTVRPSILTPNYHDYSVVSGGQGTGTVAQWTLQATKKRSRSIRATVDVTGNTITERDSNSSLVTTYSVLAKNSGSEVTTTTSWNGAGGVKGIFERIFAPLGLRSIQKSLLTNLKNHLEK